MQKAHGDFSTNGGGPTSSKVIHEDGSVRESIVSEETTLADHGYGSGDDDASTRGMVSPHSTRRSGSLEDGVSVNGNTTGTATTSKVGLGLEPPGGATSSIPTIRISTDSDREVDEEGNTTNANPGPTKDANGDPTTNGFDNSRDVSGLEKPAQAAAGEEEDKESQEPPSPNMHTQSQSQGAGNESFSFSNKRLCERWLDNLFMVLYEVC